MSELAQKLVNQLTSTRSPRTSRFDRLKSHDSADLRDVVDKLNLEPVGSEQQQQQQQRKVAPPIKLESFEMEQPDAEPQGPESNFKV